MKRLSNFIFLFLLSALMPLSMVSAQQDTTTYFVVDYMKVKPGMYGDYEKLESAWKKLHIGRIKAGKADGWYFFSVVSPSGVNTEYNYITVNSFRGEKKLALFYDAPYFPEKWESLLTAEEVALVNKTDQIRDIVKTEVWSGEDGVFADDWLTAKVHVFNYFKNKPGKTDSDHAKMEADIWKPVHAARVKDGTMKGWGLYNQLLPFGSTMPYDSGTLDVYANMEQFMTQEVEKYFEKVHPGKDMGNLFQQTTDAVELLHGEIRILLDYTFGK